MLRILFILSLFATAAQSQQVAKTWVTPAGWTAGLLEYRPPGIDTMTRKPGLIIYSHGNGEASNYTAGQALTAAALVDNNEIPKLLTGGTRFRFQEGGTGPERSFVVLSFARNTGQAPFFESVSNQYIDWSLKYMRDSLANLVDTFRIYLVGISGGGAAGWNFPGRSVADAQKIAAVVQICPTNEFATWCNIAAGNVPIWAFHADNDGTTSASGTESQINQIIACGITPTPIFTNPATGGHSIWPTYLDTNYVGSNGMNVYEWMLQYTRDPDEQITFPAGVRLYPTTENFFDLVQANKPLLWRLIDNDSTTAGLTDFFNGYIWDDYKQMGFWVNLDTFINHPRIRLFNSGSAGFTVTFQFFYSHMDTTRHSPEYSTSLPENSWKWVDSAVTREYDDSARWVKITLSSESAHNLKEIQIYGNKLGPAPSILPAPQDEPPDPGEQFQWTGKLDIDTLMDDAAAGQRIQNTMSWIYDETSAGNNKNLIYNIFSNSSDLTLLPNKRAGIPNSTYFANIRVHYEAWPGQALAKDIPFGSDSSNPANWQGVYDTYYGLAAKFGRNASANVTGYTFRNTNPGIGQDLIQELEINNEVMQHWNGRPKFHHTTVQILQQRAGYYGVKAADPTMLVDLGAMTGLREDRAKAYYLHTLFNYKSPDSIFFDQLAVNEYKTTAGQQNQVGDIDGMTPETWRFYEHLVSFRDLRDRYYPGIPLLLTEDGYDTHDSEYNVTDISGRTRRETQAHWLWRSRQICRLARWSRYVHYSKIDGNSGPFATTGYSYNLYIEQNPKDTLPAYMEQVIPPDKWDGLGTVWVQIPKETYWWMTLDMQTLQGYNAWPTAIEMGDSTGVWCLRYTHQTNPNETMLSVWMGTKDASTTSNYQVNIPGAISATLIHPQVGDKNGVESSLTVVDGVITIPTVWEGGDYVRVTLGEVENQAPTAAAGTDQSITLPTSQVTVNGSSSNDPDGTISTYLWSKISGPSTFTITNANSASTTITGLVQGTYVFRLTVTDNDSATDTDDITITVGAAPVVPGNKRGWFKGTLRNKFRN